MVVGYQPALTGAANFSDNLCRWNGKSGDHLEAWFLALNEPATQRGYLFRYAIQAARNPSADPNNPPQVASLWATAFDRLAPGRNFVVRREYGIDRFAFEGDRDFILKIGEGTFTPSHAAGRIESDGHSFEWDLDFIPNEKTYYHIPRRLGRLSGGLPFVCSPNLDMSCSGTLVIDGRKIVLNNEPGCQSHLWGRRHVDEWVWAHSNAFEAHPGTVFEGIAGRARLAGRLLPPVQSLFLRHRGEEHRFVRLRLSEQWQRSLGIGYWTFSAMNSKLYIEGTAQCRLRDMLQVQHADPDGERLYSVNSGVANLKIRLFRRVHGLRWRHVETVKAQGAAHLEHAARSIDPTVKMAF